MGMKLALDNPEEAKRQIENITVFRSTIEGISKSFQPLTDAISKLYGGNI